MKRKLKLYRLIWLKHDLPAGLSVFFVALPLCLGIALASGAPLYGGILSGIIGGIIIPIFSKSALGVSGPAAGLTTLVSASILSFGDYRIFLLSVIIAGVFQIILGLFRLGEIANYFPSSVIKGMLAAIGIILIAKQIPLTIGFNKPDFWQSTIFGLFSTVHFFGSISDFVNHISIGVILISVLSVFIIIILKNIVKENSTIPFSLIIVIIGIGISFLFSIYFTELRLNPNQLVEISPNIFKEIITPDLSLIFSDKKIWEYGILIGTLASLETLLCVEAIDKLDIHNRVTPVNRELIAQGIGNIACGLLGAIPLTAVVVRGSANIDAGARTRLSAITHGFLLLISVLFISVILNLIPIASLSIILLITGFNLTKPKLYKNMWSLGPKQFLPFIITILFIVFTDLLIGVSIGLLISIYILIQNNFRIDYQISKKLENEKETYFIKLNSNVSFLNKVNLKNALDTIEEDSILTIDGSESSFIDYDILEIISEFKTKAEDRNIKVNLKNIKEVDITAIH